MTRTMPSRTRNTQQITAVTQGNADLAEWQINKSKFTTSTGETLDAIKSYMIDSMEVIIFKVGTGPALKHTDWPKINYIGWFYDNTVFTEFERRTLLTTEFERKQAFQWKYQLRPTVLTQIFDIVLTGLKAGTIVRINVPPHMVYSNGVSPDKRIPISSNLVFDIEHLWVLTDPINEDWETVISAQNENVENKNYTREEADAYMEQIKSRAAAIYLNTETISDTGLKIIRKTEGVGEYPKPGDSIVVHYHGTLEDGTVFSSSIDRIEPFRFIFGRGNVIAAWDEAFASMRLYSKTRLVIPPHLAYKDTGSPDGSIPPNATITFDIDILYIAREGV